MLIMTRFFRAGALVLLMFYFTSHALADAVPRLDTSYIEVDASADVRLLRSIAEIDASADVRMLRSIAEIDASADVRLLRSIAEIDASADVRMLRSVVEIDASADVRLLRSTIEIDGDSGSGVPLSIQGNMVIAGGMDMTDTRIVSVRLIALNADTAFLPCEDKALLELQPLLQLAPSLDSPGWSETTFAVTLSAGSGLKTLFTRFVSPTGFSDFVSDTLLFKGASLPTPPQDIRVNGTGAFGVEIEDSRPVISWRHMDADGDTQWGFRVEIARDLAFTDVIVDYTGGAETAFHILAPGLTANRTYMIRIRTADNRGFGPPSIGSHSFRIIPGEDAPLRAPTPDIEILSTRFLITDIPALPFVPNTIRALVANIGGAPADDVTVTLYDDGDVVGAATIARLEGAPGASAEAKVSIPWTPTRVGIHTLCLAASLDGSANEADTANNAATRAVVVGEEDTGDVLRVSAEFLSPGVFKSIFVGLKAGIAGHAEYSPVFTVGGPLQGGTVRLRAIGGQRMAGLLRGETVVTDVLAEGVTNDRGDFLVRFITPPAPGLYALRIEVSDGTITGLSDELLLNVEQLTGIELTSYDADLTLDPYFLVPDGLLAEGNALIMGAVQDSPIMMKTIVRNVGDEDAHNVVVRFFDEDTFVGDAVALLVRGGESAVVEVPYSFPKVGVDWLRVVVDPENEILEATELMGLPSNNEGDPATRIIPNKPDLEPSDIVLVAYPSVPSIEASVQVWNVGGKNAGASKTEVVLASRDGTFQATQIAQLGMLPREIGVGFSDTVTFAIPGPGDYISQAYVDYNSKITEAEEGNNYIEEAIAVYAPPGGGGGGGGERDIGLDKIEIISDSSLGEQYSRCDHGACTVTVRNFLGASSPATNLDLYIDGNLYATAPVPSLSNGEILQIGFELPAWLLSAGLHDFEARLESAGADEASDYNDTIARRKNIFDCAPDAGAAAMTFTASPCCVSGVDANQTVTIRQEVTNEGTGWTGPLTVDFYAGFEYLGSVTTGRVEMGETRLVQMQYTPSSPGFVVIRTVVNDPTEDANLRNNTRSRTLVVGNPLDIRIVPETLRVTPAEPVAGSVAEFEVLVVNDGTLYDANGVEVVFRDADDTYYEDFRFTAAAGIVDIARNGGIALAKGTWEVPCAFATMTSPNPAERRIYALLDPSLSFPERNRTDNVDDFSVTVELGGIPAPPTWSYPPQGVHLQAVSEAVGAAVPGLRIFIHDNGTFIGDTGIELNGRFSLPYEFPEGAHSLTGVVSNSCGIRSDSSAELYFVVDRTPPVIMIPLVSPSRSNVTVAVTAMDSFTPSERIVLGGQTSFTSEGRHIAEITAEDEAGNISTESATVVIDRTPPVISIFSPMTGSGFGDGDSVFVAFSVTDALDPYPSNTAYLKKNGDTTSIPVLSGETMSTQFLGTGEWYLFVYGRDWVGNVSLLNSPVFSVKHDILAPRTLAVVAGFGIAADVSVSGETVTGVSAAVSFEANDDLLIIGDSAGLGVERTEYAIDNGAWTGIAVAQSVTLAGLTAGPHEVSYRSADVLGNVESTQTLNLTLDTAPPSIAIESPSAGTYVAGHDTIVVLFAASDSHDPAPSVEGVLERMSGGVTVETRLVNAGEEIAPLSLTVGEWRLTVEAQDTFGNLRTVIGETATVIHDALGPRTVAVLSAPNAIGGADGAAPGESFSTTAAVLTLTAVDDLLVIGDSAGLGVAKTEYTVDSGTALIGTTASFTSLSDGPHTISIWSTDVIGNVEAEKSLALRIDNTAPVLSTSVSAPKFESAGITYVGSSSVVSASAADAGIGLAGIWSLEFGVWSPGDSMIFATEGAHAAVFEARDILGNASAETIAVTSDLTPPNTAFSLSGPNVTVSGVTYVNASASANLAALDSLSGVAATLYSLDGVEETAGSVVAFTGLSNDAHLITYRSIDNVANAETAKTETVVVDNSAPVISPSVGAPSQSDSRGVFVTSTTPIAFSIADAGVGMGGDTLVTFFTAGEGEQTFSVSASDLLGNAADTVSVTVIADNSAPSAAYAVSAPVYRNGDTFVTSASLITFTATDAGAGVSRIEVNIDGAGFETYSVPVSFSTEGAHAISYRAVDLLGNTSTAEAISIIVDNSAPLVTATVSAPKSGSFITSATTILLAASDNSAGVAGIEISTDSGAWSAYSGTISFSTEGQHVLAYRATDNLGNMSEISSLTVIVDNSAPSTVLDIGSPRYDTGGPFVTSSTSFTFAATDNPATAAGVSATRYSIDAGSWTDELGSFALAGSDGAHSVSYYSLDVLGNIEAEHTTSVKLDNTAPAVTATASGPQYQNGGTLYGTSATLVTLAATDTGSGLSSFLVSLDGGLPTSYSGAISFATEGAHTIAWTATDNLGHATTGNITIVIDNTAPGLSLAIEIKDTTGTKVIPESRFSLIIDESVSGESAVEYRIDTGVWWPYTAAFEAGAAIGQYGDTGPKFGPHTLSVRALDHVRNSSETSFAFTLSPALEVTKTVTNSPRTLLWWNYEGGDDEGEGEDDEEAAPSAENRARIEAMLASLSLTLDTVTARDSFVDAMRSGRYNVYAVIGGKDDLDEKEAQELAERVNLGAGLLASVFDKVDGPKLRHDESGGEEARERDNVLGVKVAGKYGEDEAVRILAGALSDTNYLLATTGRAERVKATGSAVSELAGATETAGVYVGEGDEEEGEEGEDDDDHGKGKGKSGDDEGEGDDDEEGGGHSLNLAASFREYGLGKAVWFSFDFAKAADAARADTIARLLSNAMTVVTPDTAPAVTGGVFAVEIKVKSLVVPLSLNVSIEELVPNDVTILEVIPQAEVTGGALSWIVVLDAGQETAVRYTAELPDADGVVTTEADISYLVRGTYRNFGGSNVNVSVSDAGANLATARDIIAQIIPLVPTQGGDRGRAEAALETVEDLISDPPSNSDERHEAVEDLLNAVENLTRIEDADVPVLIKSARAAMGRVIVEYGIQGIEE